MTTQTKFSVRRALLAGLAVCGLLAGANLGLNAQEAKKDDKPAARASIEVSGYTRPGNPDDRFGKEGDLMRQLGFEGEIQKFKIMGGTVYFAVFKNTGLVEGDTFGTGMTSFDAKFEAGRSFKDSMSPRYDRKAKYLYLYQVVNDRALDPRINQVKGEKGGERVGWPVFDPNKVDAKAAPLLTEEIASFALKLVADPRHITSWGHFRDSGFAANVVDVDGAGKIVKNKDEKGDKIIQLSFSYLPAIVTKLSDPSYSRRARSHSLGDLEAGFGVEKSGLNMQESKAHGDIKLVADQGAKNKTVWTSFAESILKATDAGKEPEYVQLMYLSAEERAGLTGMPIIPGSAPELLDDEITRAIFRVDWRKAHTLRQGSRSVVFGFTTDLPPVNAPIRIDTPRAALVSEGMKLANYFTDEGIARATGPGGIVNVAGADGAALALALGTGLGIAPTPGPAPAEPGAGFAGITGGFGGFGGLGGATTGGGGSGFGTPSIGGGSGLLGGGGGGFGGATPGTGTGTQTQAGTGTQNGLQAINVNTNISTNFNASLINQQTQNQQQSQLQIQQQQQNQNQNNRGHNDRGHDNNHQGHVVPAPASLLLGLLGLPGLLLLRRRKTEEPTPETAV